MFFFFNSLLAAKADESFYLVRSEQVENKLEEFISQNGMSYSEYDGLDSQLKIFFGYDSEIPYNSFFPDLSIIRDSEAIRNMYRMKLNEMTTNKIIYNIKE